MSQPTAMDETKTLKRFQNYTRFPLHVGSCRFPSVAPCTCGEAPPDATSNDRTMWNDQEWTWHKATQPATTPQNATIRVRVPVHHTATVEWQEIDLSLRQFASLVNNVAEEDLPLFIVVPDPNETSSKEER